MFNDIYAGRRVLVTGHTGFKGSWLCLWLEMLGAKTFGFALEPETDLSHFYLSKPEVLCRTADIRSLQEIREAVKYARPDVIFHLAAQPLVRRSYFAPLETLHTNVMGTANLLEACRHIDSVRAIINITSDKCYEDQGNGRGCMENDPMGGSDPYSASKGCAELVIRAYRDSYFPVHTYGANHHTLVASARAGNVIGGGDWGADRLLPDIIRAAAAKKQLKVRNPGHIRPWQHVLDPLCGYLILGKYLLEGRSEYAGAWNFGPAGDTRVTVASIVEMVQNHWDDFSYTFAHETEPLPETATLHLDSSRARKSLNWEPVWDVSDSVQKTVDWYRSFYHNGGILSRKQLQDYCLEAERTGACWVERSGSEGPGV
ncbi:CDP-glucose 4,6-dehydratase [Desulfonatronospira thiodismutans ASO3-1]|uniref:CDP-glucose 4,6-dehydratase n=2 Tax=Desulfonatronospira thiodismutans TaxID=488939 RepID=D6SN91_9BACT|nr:CDP-glucose 4,6-dehydratase [Desulfonatronospira thiodismutans ASO3-1]